MPHLPKHKSPITKKFRSSKNWFSAENQGRQRTPITSLETYYHCANLPGAEGIVREQVSLIKRLKLPNVHITVLGEIIPELEEFNIIHHSWNYQEYEHPTIQAIWESAIEDENRGFIYFHTKAASAPNDAVKNNWRRVMTEGLLYDWEENARHLNDCDLVGCNWGGGVDFPHFPGTFFFARGDWISHLRSPAEYKRLGQNIWFSGQCWDRMHAELYIGHMPYHKVKSLVTMYEYWETFARRGM
jgi:hypothetical protein